MAAEKHRHHTSNANLYQEHYGPQFRASAPNRIQHDLQNGGKGGPLEIETERISPSTVLLRPSICLVFVPGRRVNERIATNAASRFQKRYTSRSNFCENACSPTHLSFLLGVSFFTRYYERHNKTRQAAPTTRRWSAVVLT